MSRRKALAASIKKYQSCKLTKEELRQLLSSGIFGRVTGVIGPFVLRYQNDKLIISDRPKMFRMSMNPAAVEGRKNFSASVKFAKFLMDIPVIKSAWEMADLNGRAAWNRIIKYNHMINYPDVKNSITPEKHHFGNEAVCKLNEDFRIEVNNYHLLNEHDTLFIIIVPFDPVTKRFEMIGISSSPKADEFTLNKDQIGTLKRYSEYVIYSAIIRENGKCLEWSNTTVSEGKIEHADVLYFALYNKSMAIITQICESECIWLYFVPMRTRNCSTAYHFQQDSS